jgi:hypothetical protein
VAQSGLAPQYAGDFESSRRHVTGSEDKDTNEITIEAWVKRAATVLGDQQPGRIVTMSVDPSRRNFTLGQTSNEEFQIRLCTTLTDDNGVNLRNMQ